MTKLQEKRNTLYAELSTLFETAENESRAFNDEEETKFTSLSKEIADLDKQIKRETEHRNLELAKPSDIEEIYQILIGTFNPFSDTLPNRYEIGELIKQDSILVNRDHLSEKINGALLLRFEPQKCHIYIWVSSSNFNESLNLFFNGFNYMAERGYKKAYLWVRTSNKRPRMIYQTLGFQFDGLVDYTYTKHD